MLFQNNKFYRKQTWTKPEGVHMFFPGGQQRSETAGLLIFLPFDDMILDLLHLI
jgi:hypothetical protein